MSTFIRKAKTRRGKKFLESRVPKVTENDKTALLLKGGKTNEKLTKFLMDVYHLKNPLVEKLTQQEEPRPSVRRRDVHRADGPKVRRLSLPDGLQEQTLPGRCHSRPSVRLPAAGHGRPEAAQLQAALRLQAARLSVGTKPCITLQGLNFENDETMKKIGNMLVDFFRGPVIPKIRLQGLELVLSFTATDDRIYMRTYRSLLKKSDDVLPRVELVEVGPSADFEVTRHKFASDGLMRRAMKKPKGLKQKMRKNTSQDVFGTKHDRIHVGRQQVHKIQTRKVKALRKSAPFEE